MLQIQSMEYSRRWSKDEDFRCVGEYSQEIVSDKVRVLRLDLKLKEFDHFA